MYGIVTALPSEGDAVVDQMQDIQESIMGGVNYITGIMNGRAVVTTVTGIGKINAAAITSRLIENFNPAAVFLSGIAGAINSELLVGDIIVGTKLYSVENFKIANPLKRDVINATNRKPNTEMLEADSYLLEIAKSMYTAERKKKIVYGLIATTDIYPPYAQQVMSLQEMGVDAIDMEGFAVMQVCWLFNKPCLIVRSISDYSTKSLEPNYQAEKYEIRDEHKKTAAGNACGFIASMLEALPESQWS